MSSFQFTIKRLEIFSNIFKRVFNSKQVHVQSPEKCLKMTLFWVMFATSIFRKLHLTRQLTCSKLTIETLEQGVKYANGVVVVPLLLTLNIFHTCSSVSIVTFEHVNADWDHSIATLSDIHSTTDVIMKNKIKLILRKEKFRVPRAKISKYPFLTWN